MKLNIKKSLSLALASMSLLLPSVSAVPPEASEHISTIISECDKTKLDDEKYSEDYARRLYSLFSKEPIEGRTYSRLRMLPRHQRMLKSFIKKLVIQDLRKTTKHASKLLLYKLINLYYSNGTDVEATTTEAQDEWLKGLEYSRIPREEFDSLEGKSRQDSIKNRIIECDRCFAERFIVDDFSGRIGVGFRRKGPMEFPINLNEDSIWISVGFHVYPITFSHVDEFCKQITSCEDEYEIDDHCLECAKRIYKQYAIDAKEEDPLTHVHKALSMSEEEVNKLIDTIKLSGGKISLAILYYLFNLCLSDGKDPYALTGPVHNTWIDFVNKGGFNSRFLRFTLCGPLDHLLSEGLHINITKDTTEKPSKVRFEICGKGNCLYFVVFIKD